MLSITRVKSNLYVIALESIQVEAQTSVGKRNYLKPECDCFLHLLSKCMGLQPPVIELKMHNGRFLTTDTINF